MIAYIGSSKCKSQHYFSLLKYLMVFFLVGQGWMLAQDAPYAQGDAFGGGDSIQAAGWGEVVINEVMADPNPPVDFAQEYLELYNRSGRVADVVDWVLHVNSRAYSLSASLMPAGTLLVPGAFGVVLGLTLPNEGATLALYDPLGNLVHAARYQLPWDGADWKKEGGWSLESPDPDQLCMISELWEFSTDPAGGTPGRSNSNLAVLEDMEGPVLLYSGYNDPSDEALGEGDPGLLRLYFSEPVVMSPADLEEIELLPGNLHPQTAHLLAPLSNILELRFPADLQERPHFKVRIPRVSDCQGNDRLSLEAMAGSVSEPVLGGVQINEIMYDPAEGCPEYIELALPGNRFYDLRDLAMHVVDEGAPADDPLPLSDHSRLMLPGSYLVVTACVEHLREAYHLPRSGQWVEAKGLKMLNHSRGTLYLTDRAGNVVDRADYGDHMHSEVLSDTRGISLERISGKRSGSDPDNWHSAAAIEAYATPGRVNSQAMNETEKDQLFRVEPLVFSPDNDGFQDLLEIVVSSRVSGWIITLWITDLQGNLMRNLANNHLTGPVALYTWDGACEDGSMVPPGIYVVHATAYHPATDRRWIRKGAAGVVYR
jgi:hypothetical protein